MVGEYSPEGIMTISVNKSFDCEGHPDEWDAKMLIRRIMMIRRLS